MKKKIYLTIDDAPSSWLGSKIDYLVEREIPAVLYCRGEFMEKYLDRVIYAIEKGYCIGNHSYSHPKFSTISLQEAKDEISATEKLIQRAHSLAGIAREYKLFRFPYLDKGEKKSLDHAIALQCLLKEYGFQRADFLNITYSYMVKNSYLNDIDAPWTFDGCEYALFTEASQKKYGLYNVKDFLLRMDREEPEGGFGLHANSSSDIVLLHDFESTHHLFKPMMEHLRALNVDFVLPKIIAP